MFLSIFLIWAALQIEVEGSGEGNGLQFLFLDYGHILD